jgi:hypothetical protein
VAGVEEIDASPPNIADLRSAIEILQQIGGHPYPCQASDFKRELIEILTCCRARA